MGGGEREVLKGDELEEMFINHLLLVVKLAGALLNSWLQALGPELESPV